MDCNIDSLLGGLDNSTNLREDAALQAVYCAYSGSLSCLGICPNPDVSGVGVRYSFYFNSIANAVLVAASPSDAAAGAWSSTILTAALIGPALLQKAWQNMTLHHSYIVAGLGTLSAVSSLATAPMVPIWRGGKQASRLDAVDYTMDKAESERGRVVLAFALIIQIILVFAWVTILFVNPLYSQESCSGPTTLVWLGGRESAYYIDEKRYWAWTLWLFSYAAVTAAFGVVLVYSCQSKVHDIPDKPRNTPVTRMSWWRRWWAARPLLVPNPEEAHYRVRVAIRASKWVAGLIVASYAIMTEVQIHANKGMILPGEDNIWSFSQAAAVMLSVAPLWPLAMAYSDKRRNGPARQRRNSSVTVTPQQLSPARLPSSPPRVSPTLSPPPIRHRRRRLSNEGSEAFSSSSNDDSENSPFMSQPSYFDRSGDSSFVQLPLFSLPQKPANATMPYLTLTGPESEEVMLDDSGHDPRLSADRLRTRGINQRRGHRASGSDGGLDLNTM
ncbi:hypothetical protein FRB93_013342 [Tulasnella sp. JGI-2019a]|nr:hypothetical protein FRB93_013342 [Tulasnella sp. JGI-2019a]